MTEKDFLVFNIDFERAEQTEMSDLEESLQKLKKFKLPYFNDNFSGVVKKIGLAGPEYHSIFPFFYLESYRVVAEKNKNNRYCHATVAIKSDRKRIIEAGEGNGPVDSLYQALYSTIEKIYPEVQELIFRDYRVRTLSDDSGSAQQVFVIIEFVYGEKSWLNVGVSTDIIEASWRAIYGGMNFFLMKKLEEKIMIAV